MDARRQSPLMAFLIFLFGLYGLLLLLYLVLRLVLSDTVTWLALLHNIAPYLFVLLPIGLIVGLLGRAKRLVALQLILLVVGVAWFGVALLPQAPPDAQDTPITVMTLNVYPENDDVADAVRYILSRDPDVVALQEVAPGQDWSELDAHYPHMESNEGLFVYSRFDIMESTPIALSGTEVQRVLLDIEDETVALYNVHLTWPFNPDSDAPILARYDESVRNADIDALLALLEDEEEDEYFVVGDFNTSDSSPAYARLNSQLTDAYRTSSWGLGATWPAASFEEFNVPAWIPRLLRLDYVFHSEDLTAQSAIVGPRVGSDNLPLLVSLTIEG